MTNDACQNKIHAGKSKYYWYRVQQEYSELRMLSVLAIDYSTIHFACIWDNIIHNVEILHSS